MLKQIKEYGIKFSDLKAACAAMNDANLLEEKIAVKVGIKGEAMLEAFLNYVDSVPTKKTKLIPAVAADFYNALPQSVFADVADDEDEDDLLDEEDAEEDAADSDVDEAEDEDAEEDEEEEPVKEKKPSKKMTKVPPKKPTKKAKVEVEEEEVDDIPEEEEEDTAPESDDDCTTSECPTFKSGWDEKEEDCQGCERDFNNEYEACKKACLALKKQKKSKLGKVKAAKKKGPKQPTGPRKIHGMSRSRYGHAPYTMAGRIDDMIWEGASRKEIVDVLVEEFDRTESKAKGKLIAHVKHLRTDLRMSIVEKDGSFSTDVEYADGYSAENTISSRQ